MLAWLAVIIFCSAVSAKLSGREDVVYPTLVTSRSGLKIMKFSALGQNIQLTLEPAGELISDKLAVVHNGELKYSMNAKSMKNKLYRDKQHGAALHIDEDGPLTINGIISDKLRIKPYKSKMRKDGRVAHRIVELEKDEYSRIYDVVSENIANKPSNPVRYSYAEGDCVRVDFVFISDSTFTGNFKNTEKLEDYLGVMIVAMQNRIDTLNLEIKIRYKGVITYTEKNEPYFFNISTMTVNESVYLKATKILDSVNAFYCKLQYFPEDVKELIELADIAILVTIRRLGHFDNKGRFNRIAGISNLGRVCNPCKKIAVCKSDADYNQMVDTFAHESTHLLGSPHDGEGPQPQIPNSPGSVDCPIEDGHLMSNWKNDINGSTFSICSRKNVQNLLSLPGYGCIFESCDQK